MSHRRNLAIFFLYILDCLSNQASSQKCGSGDPCIFMDKDVGWILYTEPKGPKPFPPKTDSWKKNDTTLFIMIASFRDKLCPITLFNIYTKAAHPSRIFSGVVQQNVDEEDKDCLEEYCRLSVGNSSRDCPYKDNIRMNRVDARIAKGPTWARALGSKMLQNEEFCMQTDSHMDFVPNWDIRMFEMWGSTKNEYGILSTYVADSEQLPNNINGKSGLNGLHEVPHLCMVTFGGAYGMVRNWGTKCMRNLPVPKMTNMIWGAGLSFSKCHAERKAPYDPHTPHIFDGEEFSRALRFWTYGYDIYSPHRVYVVHNYHVSQSDPKHSQWAWNTDQGETKVEDSVYRLKTQLSLPGGEPNPETALAIQRSRYGLGDRRSIDQAIEFSGIDTKHQRTLRNGCGNLEFVPFIEHPLGPDYIPSFDPITEAPLDVPDIGSIYYQKLNTVVNHGQVLAAITESNSQVNQNENYVHAREHLREDFRNRNNNNNNDNDNSHHLNPLDTTSHDKSNSNIIDMFPSIDSEPVREIPNSLQVPDLEVINSHSLVSYIDKVPPVVPQPPKLLSDNYPKNIVVEKHPAKGEKVESSEIKDLLHLGNVRNIGDMESLMENEYAALIRLERRAESVLSDAGLVYHQEPSISVFAIFLCLFTLGFGICWVACGYRVHFGKNHRTASLYDPIKSV